jgi:hypothetical protein
MLAGYDAQVAAQTVALRLGEGITELALEDTHRTPLGVDMTRSTRLFNLGQIRRTTGVRSALLRGSLLGSPNRSVGRKTLPDEKNAS